MNPPKSYGKPPRRRLEEAELIVRVVEMFRNAGCHVRREVPNMGQSVDIVATRGRCLIAIEAKRDNWRRAVRQCRAHLAVADLICIAIGTASVSPRLQELAGQLNYGIIHCPPSSTECLWVTKPRRNRNVWLPQRQFFQRRLTEIDTWQSTIG